MSPRTATLSGWLLCLPAIAIFGCFFLGPALVGAYVSLHLWNGSSPTLTFIGLRNYADLLVDARFWNALWVTLAAFLSMVLIKLPFALAIAVGLAKLGRMARLYRAALFL